MNYFVFSNYINAWTIKKGLSRLGISLQVMAESGLLPVSKLRPSPGDTLFFTEEKNLLFYHDSSDYYFYPRLKDPKLIDDKLYFSEYILTIGEKPVPSWEIPDDITKKAPELPIYIKARHSWRDNHKLPRGYPCYSENSRLGIIRELKRNGWRLEMFFYQRLLHSPLSNNISVSGFFDYQNKKRNLFQITQKLLGDTERMATGLIVITCPDPGQLIERTNFILEHIQYIGPFELEFYYEETDDVYYVLEINPRFWMQHGLFLSFLDNGLIKRYLNMDQEEDWNKSSLYNQPLLWVNNIALLSSLIKFKFNILKLILKTMRQNAKLCFYPNLLVSLKYVVGLILKRIKINFIRNRGETF